MEYKNITKRNVFAQGYDCIQLHLLGGKYVQQVTMGSSTTQYWDMLAWPWLAKRNIL